MGNIAEKNFLRRKAGLASIKEEISKVRTVDAEAQLLGAFARFLGDLKRLKENIKNPYRYAPVGPGPMGDVDSKKDVDMDMLKKIAEMKMNLVKEVINELFGSENSEEDEEDEEDEESEEDED